MARSQWYKAKAKQPLHPACCLFHTGSELQSLVGAAEVAAAVKKSTQKNKKIILAVSQMLFHRPPPRPAWLTFSLESTSFGKSLHAVDLQNLLRGGAHHQDFGVLSAPKKSSR